jgi:hypothetical protein
LSHTASDLRVGGVAALVGGLGGLVGNVLHPPPPAETDALLRVVAQMPHWTAIHLMIAVSAVGGVAVLGGAMCFWHGSSVALGLASPLPVWPAGAAVDSLWLLAIGVAMLRKAQPKRFRPGAVTV